MSDFHGLIPHQAGYYYITLEEDYVVLFEQHAHQLFDASEKTTADEKVRDVRLGHAVAKAYISSVLEQLSDSVYKASRAEEDIWVFLSFPELEQRLHKAYKMRTLKEAMKELTDDGFVLKRPNRDPRFKALEYQMNLTRYREGLLGLPRKADKKPQGRGASGHDDSAKMHDDSAKMHDDSAKMHDDSAKMHDAQCKNAPKNKQIDSTKNNSEQLREIPTSFANGETENRALAQPNDALSLIASVFHLPVEDARKVIGVVRRLQKGALPSTGAQPARQRSPASTGERGGPATGHRRAASADVSLTLQGQHILDLYDAFKKRKTSRTTSTLLAANGLGEVVGRDEDFLEVLKAIASDEFLTRKKVRWDLDYVFRKYDGFLDRVEQARGSPLPGAVGEKTNYNEVAGMTDEQREAYKHQQQAKHALPGVNREALMQMKPEERIAYLKQVREQQRATA